ncbi:MAG: YbjN domain-containing protein [Deltaproteobacteria bacterium]|nr:YbjN domain-containing protein [Deltaproteobacteria bacterium]
MKRIAAVMVIALCLAGFSGFPAFAEDGEAMTSINAGVLQGIITEAGYSAEQQKENVLKVKMGEVTVLFFVSDNLQSIQAYAGFKGGDASLKNINEWNKNKRYSRAYKDNDGDAVVELDLDLEGGVSRSRIVNFIQTVALSAKVFREHIFGAN